MGGQIKVRLGVGPRSEAVDDLDSRVGDCCCDLVLVVVWDTEHANKGRSCLEEFDGFLPVGTEEPAEGRAKVLEHLDAVWTAEDVYPGVFDSSVGQCG